MNEIEEIFGKDKDNIVREVIEEERFIIHFFQDSEKVAKFLELVTETKLDKKCEYFEQLILLRLEVYWFDCALLLLEGEDVFDFYAPEQIQKAKEYLHTYYRPIAPEENFNWREFWNWILQQKNVFINGFLQNWNRGFTYAFPAETPLGASYEKETEYEKLEFPIANKRQLKLSISFNWDDNKLRGKISPIVLTEGEEGKKNIDKDFLSRIRIDICKGEKIGIKPKCFVKKDLAVNSIGLFTVTSIKQEIDSIRHSLEEQEIWCVIKITDC